MRYFMRSAFVGALLASAPAMAEAPPVSAYGNLPDITAMDIAPDGSRLAAAMTLKGAPTVVVWDSTGKPLVALPAGEAKIRDVQWVGPGHLVVRASQTTAVPAEFRRLRYEAFGSIVLDVDKGTTKQIFEGDQSKLKLTFGHYGMRQIDGKWNLFVSGQGLDREFGNTGYVLNGRTSPGLFKIDVAAMKEKQVATGGDQGEWATWLVDAAGNVGAKLAISNQGGIWRIENSAKKKIVSGVAPDGNVDLVTLGYDGNSVIYSLAPIGSEVQWMEVPLSGGTPKPFLENVPVNRIYRHPVTGSMLGYLEDGKAFPKMADPAIEQTMQQLAASFLGRHPRLEGISPDLTKFIVHTSGNKDSGSWYLIDTVSMNANILGRDYPAISNEAVGPVRIVRYQAADGLQMDGVLTLPPGREAKTLPVVMLPHGGPYSHDTTNFDWWAQAYASRGYAVFQPNFRGSTNRDLAFQRAADGEWGRKMQSDISDGLAELAKQGIVHPRRACIVGGSYGGYAALAGVTLQKDIYKCAVAVAPVSDITDMLIKDDLSMFFGKVGRDSIDRNFGPRSTWSQVSPRDHAQQANAPILLIHGKDDSVVPIYHSTSMKAALERAGKPVELVTLDGEDHWLSTSATRQKMLEAAVAFVERHNPAD
ncbi:alpha/beta hydrolase family protein [Croceicoccus ponticola]|nr:alpha/beta fold hydrolase [Croceicoccus ponticola]